MALVPPTQEERNANLDALQLALNQWAQTEQTRLENEVRFMRSVLTGRGVQEAGTQNLAMANRFMQLELIQFIDRQ
jgi:hypothetical protein